MPNLKHKPHFATMGNKKRNKPPPLRHIFDKSLNFCDRSSTEAAISERNQQNVVDPALKQSISQLIRQEVATVLTAPSFKREMTEQLLLLNPTFKEHHSESEYVRMDDLHAIVNKIISWNGVDKASEAVGSNNKRFAESIEEINDQLENINERVDILTHDLKSMTPHNCPQRNEKTITSIRQTNSDANSNSSNQGNVASDESHLNKMRIYDELVCKFSRMVKADETNHSHSLLPANTRKTCVRERPLESQPHGCSRQCPHRCQTNNRRNICPLFTDAQSDRKMCCAHCSSASSDPADDSPSD